MLTQNGQSVCQNCNSANASVDARQASEIQNSLSPAQIEFLDFVMFQGVYELSASLKLIHDLALYHSDLPFDNDEKSALFDLKMLWEMLEKIEKEL